MSDAHPRPPKQMIEQSSSIPEEAVARTDRLLFSALIALGTIAVLCLSGVLLLTLNGQEGSPTVAVLAGIVTTIVGIVGGLLSPIGR